MDQEDKKPVSEMPDKLRGLGYTPRQVDVVKKVCQGLINREIGELLFVSEKCVKYHLTNLFKKSGVKNRTELAAWASSL